MNSPMHYEASAAPAQDQQLRQYIERIERLESEEKGIKDDKRDVFLEAKAMGYNPKAMREVLKKRKMDAMDRQTLEAEVQLYGEQLGLF